MQMEFKFDFRPTIDNQQVSTHRNNLLNHTAPSNESMGIDTFCPLSGLHYFYKDDFLDNIESDQYSNEKAKYSSADLQYKAEIERGLLRSTEDVEHSRFYAMICVQGSSRRLTGVEDLMWPHEAPGNYDCPTHIDESNTMEIFNLVANNTGDVDIFRSLDLTDKTYGGPVQFIHHCFQTGIAVNFWAYIIFRHACPKILPHILFTLYRDLQQALGRQLHWGTFCGVDYGPTWGTNEQFVLWQHLGRCREEDEPCWPGLLYQNKPVTEILDDAWNGPGALWTTVRPNKFPIEEAMQPLLTLPADESHQPGSWKQEYCLMACPLDILLEIAQYLLPRQLAPLLSASKAMRSFLVNHIDRLTYQYIRIHQPWLLPAGPVPFADSRFSRKEIDAWVEGWSNAGFDSERLEMEIPWYAYVRECSKSMSMRSRRRIWGIAKQIETLAIKREYI